MIVIPTECPSCSSSLELVNDQLYCRNKECPAQASKQVEHFTKTLKIKGFGPQTIAKLNLSSFYDLYELTEEELIDRLSSAKTGAKLYQEIQASKANALEALLPALGIPLIGKSAAAKLQQVCSSIDDITEQSCKEAGLGEKATNNLWTWLVTNREELNTLPFNFLFSKRAEPSGNSHSSTNKGVICISGKLNSFPTKQIAKQELETLGFTVKDTLTKDVTILVNESGRETDKTKNAAARGVRIVTNLTEFLGELN